MALEGRPAVRRELEDSIAQIRLLPPGQYAAGVSAFNLLRKGTLHAATGREAPLPELLDDLEPKAEVLQFLAGFYEEKRIYRKQIAAVLTVLLQSAAWRAVLEGDEGLRGQVPQDLLELAGVAARPAPEETVDTASAEAAAAEPTASAEGMGTENGGVASDVAPSSPPAALAPDDEGSSPCPPRRDPTTATSIAAPPPADPDRAARKEEAAASRPQPSEPSCRGGAPAASSPAAADAAALETASEGGAEAEVPGVSVCSFDVRAAIAAAKARAPRPAPPARDEDARALLLAAQRQIEAVAGGAASSDEALTAFESFRRAVAKATSTSSVGGQEALDGFEAKSLVFRFLVDFADKKRTHRSRIASMLTCLLGMDSWRAAAEGADPLVGTALCKLTGDASTPLVKVGDSVAVDLQAAAAKVASAGGIGALCLHVIAVHDLVAKGTHPRPSPYVRVSLGDRIQRTAVSCHCRWDAAPPFVFEVRSLQETVRLEVLDSRLRRDELLGALEVPVAAVPRQTGLASSRRALDGVPHAELELGFALAVTSPSCAAGAAGEAAAQTLGPRSDAGVRPAGADRPAPDLGGPVVRRRAGPSECPVVPELLERAMESAIQSLRAWEWGGVVDAADSTGQVLLCPSGHPVTKRKEGLRWHQKAEFWRQSACDFCSEDIDPDSVRWRCQHHCNFDLCEACYAEAHAMAERAGSDDALGVDSVQMPREAVEHRSEAVFFGIDVARAGDGGQDRVMRRYSEFFSLAETLGPRARCFANAPFPEKLFFGCVGEKLEERRRGLELWLRQVVLSSASLRTWQGPVREFLRLPPADGSSR